MCWSQGSWQQHLQASPWQPLAPLGREHSRSPARVPCSERSGGSNRRDASPLRPPHGDGRQREQSQQRGCDAGRQLRCGGGGGSQQARQIHQHLTPPAASPEQPRNRSLACRNCCTMLHVTTARLMLQCGHAVCCHDTCAAQKSNEPGCSQVWSRNAAAAASAGHATPAAGSQ
jgi:hypothetical protein